MAMISPVAVKASPVRLLAGEQAAADASTRRAGIRRTPNQHQQSFTVPEPEP